MFRIFSSKEEDEQPTQLQEPILVSTGGIRSVGGFFSSPLSYYDILSLWTYESPRWMNFIYLKELFEILLASMVRWNSSLDVLVGTRKLEAKNW